MKFRPTNPSSGSANSAIGGPPVRHSAAAGFTLAEVLAALLFMAIVIPVAIEGLRIANLAGQVGIRKAVAGRIGDNVLNELIATGQFTRSPQNGSVTEGPYQYDWESRLDTWSLGSLKVLTVQVNFPVQGQDYDVRLSTLVDTTTQ